MSLRRPACVLFDLDGTLLDTAPDMARALNRLRAERGLAALPFEVLRPVVSHGSVGLLRVGFDRRPDDADYPELQQRFLALYRADLAAATALFAGMDSVLDWLEAQRIAWGVVTNKPGWLTEPLMAELDLTRRAACIVSGDTLAERKPHPAPLLYACQHIGADPLASVYVGDAERDIEAGRRVGMTTLAAAYGYLHADEDPLAWHPDGLLDSPAALLDWLQTA